MSSPLEAVGQFPVARRPGQARHRGAAGMDGPRRGGARLPAARRAAVEEIAAAYARPVRDARGRDPRGAVDRPPQAERGDAAAVRRADWEPPVPVPHDVPWFPQDIDNWTVRWVALHLIEELTRHAGHGDIIRESVDGATMYELMAASRAGRRPSGSSPGSRPRRSSPAETPA